jgi:hypothetical protein
MSVDLDVFYDRVATGFERRMIHPDPTLIAWDTATLAERLVRAITWHDRNWHHTSTSEIHHWLKFAGREKMLAAGKALPIPGPFVLYRGVAGDGIHRRRRGVSWADSLKQAQWFAKSLPAPRGPRRLQGHGGREACFLP